MSQIEKLIDRLRSKPSDMRPVELIRVFRHFGYGVRKRKGSHCTCHKDGRYPMTVPLNVRQLKKSYIIRAIRILGLEEDENEQQS